MEDMGMARARRASPAAASNANNAQSQLSSESSQNPKILVGVENDFINHSTGYAYSYDPVQAQAQAAQVYANNVQVGCAPFVGYGYDHIQGGGPHIPHAWHNHQQSAAFASHYGPPQNTPGAPQNQPQPWPRPQPQRRLPAIEQLGLDHSYSSGGGRSVDSILVKLCPSPSPSTSPGLNGGPPLEPWLQQRQISSLEVNHQLQPGRSPSFSSPPPYLAPHGEYVPLLVNVRKLRNHETIKDLIDKEDLLVMMDYGGTNNQTNRVYKYPRSADTPNQSPLPPGTIADASASTYQGQVGGRASSSYPAAAAAAKPKKDLFVFHVPDDMTEGELYKLFSQFGKLRRARIHHDIIDGKKESKGFGFVTFKRFSDAVVAVHSLNGYKVGEKNKKALAVTYCKDTPRPDPTNFSVSANNGTNRNSADNDKRRARRVQSRFSN